MMYCDPSSLHSTHTLTDRLLKTRADHAPLASCLYTLCQHGPICSTVGSARVLVKIGFVNPKRDAAASTYHCHLVVDYRIQDPVQGILLLVAFPQGVRRKMQAMSSSGNPESGTKAPFEIVLASAICSNRYAASGESWNPKLRSHLITDMLNCLLQ